ncbi:MAG: hypothetical protein JWO03_176 [Bacteroidetes bacterium]|nr:hypothetical protein [Bacteroidota bacterium]
MKSYKSLIVFFVCCVVLAGAPLIPKKWERQYTGTVITWDIFGYWLYLPSFFYDDLGKLKHYDAILDKYKAANKDQAFIHPETGKYVLFYPCGQAIINLPAFVAGHIWAKAGGYEVDGFSRPYQIALSFWCVIVACLGLWFLRKLLLRYFDDWIAAVVLLVLCLATNYLNFAGFSPMTHAFLFAIYAAILYLTDSFYADSRRRLWHVALIGLLSGLATITRPTEIICVCIPLLWGVGNMAAFRERIGFLLEKKSVVAVYLLGALIATLPQLVYWKIYSGHWLYFSYQGYGHSFSFLRPHIFDVLLSYQKGWFVYTPVMFLSILGFYQLYKNYRQIFWCITIFTLVNLYLVSAWDVWWYGGSFSMRALVQSYALLMFPMAAFLDDMLRRKYWKFLIAAVLLFCTWLNLLMTWEVNMPMPYGSIEGEGMTAAYYWRIFGTTNITLKDRKLLDTNEEMPEKLEPSLKEVYRMDMGKKYDDSIVSFDGRQCFVMDGVRDWSQRFKVPADHTIRKGWYRVYAKAFFPDKEWNMWKQTQFTVGFYRDDETVKQKMIRIQRITDQGAWHEVYIDTKVPNKEYDYLAVSFCMAGSRKPIYLTDIRVEYTPAK